MSRLRRLALVLAVIQLVRCWRQEGGRYVVHNLFGHPGLVLAYGRVGEALHRETIPEDDEDAEPPLTVQDEGGLDHPPEPGRHRVHLPGPISGRSTVVDHPADCPAVGPDRRVEDPTVCPVVRALVTRRVWPVQGDYFTTNGVDFVRCAWQPGRSD